MGKRTLKSTAYHEAGHAVVSIATGLPFDSVTITPGDGYRGALVYSQGFSIFGEKSTQEIALAKKAILVSLAGSIAEEKLNGRYSQMSAVVDMFNAEALALQLAKNPDAYLNRKRNEARQIITDEWSFVVRLAESLLNRKILSYADVIELKSN